MKLLTIPLVALGLLSMSFNCNSTKALAKDLPESKISLQDKYSALSNSTTIDLKELIANPKKYNFFTFRPNLEKLILSGDANTQHISILWYTIPNGSVGLHYHSMTESVYTINGSQTDAKGVYPTGSLYFNPPESGHKVSDSTGFFLLSYAAPPDFKNIDKIKPYTPVKINTLDPDLEKNYAFTNPKSGVKVYSIPLDPKGGMSSQIIKSTSLTSYTYSGNYLLVLKGSCNIDGRNFKKDMLIVAKTIKTESYKLSATKDNSCLALGLSF
jgi:ChrR Cupin-like domain